MINYTAQTILMGEGQWRSGRFKRGLMKTKNKTAYQLLCCNESINCSMQIIFLNFNCHNHTHNRKHIYKIVCILILSPPFHCPTSILFPSGILSAPFLSNVLLSFSLLLLLFSLLLASLLSDLKVKERFNCRLKKEASSFHTGFSKSQ